MARTHLIHFGEALDTLHYLQDQAQYVRDCGTKMMNAERELNIKKLAFGEDSQQYKDFVAKYEELCKAYKDGAAEYDERAAQMLRDIEEMKKLGMDKKSYETWLCSYSRFLSMQHTADYMQEHGWYRDSENASAVYYLLYARKNLQLYQQILNKRKAGE